MGGGTAVPGVDYMPVDGVATFVPGLQTFFPMILVLRNPAGGDAAVIAAGW